MDVQVFPNYVQVWMYKYVPIMYKYGQNDVQVSHGYCERRV